MRESTQEKTVFLKALGAALRAAPLAALTPPARWTLDLMRRRHGRLFARLPRDGGRSLLVEPTDLPVAFLFLLDPDSPSVEVVRDPVREAAAARIAGPLGVLIALLEGRVDGDASFFSRDLVIEGDTELVVRLRNLIEGAEIDIVADALSFLGPFEQIAGGARPHLARLRERLLGL